MCSRSLGIAGQLGAEFTVICPAQSHLVDLTNCMDFVELEHVIVAACQEWEGAIGPVAGHCTMTVAPQF